MKNNLMVRLWKKILQRYHGIPIVVIVYKPWRTGKNVDVHIASRIGEDDYLGVRFREIAEYIRANYQEQLDEMMESKQPIDNNDER